MTEWEDSHPITPEEQKWRDRVSNLIDQFIAALESRLEHLPLDNEDRDTRVKEVGDIVNAAHGLRHRALYRPLFSDGKYWEPMGPVPAGLLEIVQARKAAQRKDAAHKLITTFDLNPAQEERIVQIIARRTDDEDIRQFIDDLQELRKRGSRAAMGVELWQKQMRLTSSLSKSFRSFSQCVEADRIRR